MAVKRWKTDLSVSGIDNLISQLESYQDDLERKCQLFCEKLAEKGIEVAQRKLTGSGFSKYITFTVETAPEETGCKALMVASQTGSILSIWQSRDGVESAEVSPLLMAEFGSGQYAVDGHRGTFPGQIHAFEDKWFWKDMENNWHSSSGIKPRRPMFEAAQEMIRQVKEVEQEVFGNG